MTHEAKCLPKWEDACGNALTQGYRGSIEDAHISFFKNLFIFIVSGITKRG